MKKLINFISKDRWTLKQFILIVLCAIAFVIMFSALFCSCNASGKECMINAINKYPNHTVYSVYNREFSYIIQDSLGNLSSVHCNDMLSNAVTIEYPLVKVSNGK